MKKFLLLLLITAICFSLLSGCTEEQNLVGIYMAKSTSAPNDAIVLHENGLCAYFGDNTATWKAADNLVTITQTDPDTYYLDVYFEEGISLLEKQYIESQCYFKENVKNCKLKKEEGLIRCEIKNNDQATKTQEALSEIYAVEKVEYVISKGDVHTYEYKIMDNCLVSDGGSVYIKQEK